MGVSPDDGDKPLLPGPLLSCGWENKSPERGIGNGISLIIFAGIVTRLPNAIGNTFRLMTTGEMPIFQVLILVVFMVAVVGFIIFVEQGQRRIPVQYAKRVVGRKIYGGQSTHLPLKINTSGVIPPIFASSIIMFPATLASFIKLPWMQNISQAIQPGNVIYELLYVAFIFFFVIFIRPLPLILPTLRKT